MTIEDVRPELARRLRQRPDFITISSLDRPRCDAPARARSRSSTTDTSSRVSTAELNRFLGELKEMRQPPSKGSRRLNVLYGAQVATRPPRFRLTVNDPGARHTRLRATGWRTSSASASTSRASRCRRFPRTLVRSSSSARARGGRRSRGLLRDRGHDVVRRKAGTHRRTRRSRRPTLVVIAVPSSAFARGAGRVRAPRRCSSSPRGSIRQTGNRLSTLVHGRPVAVLSGPNMADEVAAACPAQP